MMIINIDYYSLEYFDVLCIKGPFRLLKDLELGLAFDPLLILISPFSSQ